jgi:hypothetical protein
MNETLFPDADAKFHSAALARDRIRFLLKILSRRAAFLLNGRE